MGNNIVVQGRILQEMHSSAMAGHSGVQVTYIRVRRLFVWPGMKEHVQKFVAACGVCQQAKVEHVRYPGLLQPLPVPEHSWQMVSLDFIEGLPRSANHNCILVVVDKLTKYAHFLALTHPFTAWSVAKAYLDNVYKLHGLPKYLISDRDRVFTSTLWKELFKGSGTQLCMSTAYHPQTDGQTERVNQCLEGYLRCFVNSSPGKWHSWLSLAEYWYNTTPHSALGCAPFEALYGHPPQQLGLTEKAVCAEQGVQEWLTERKLKTALLRQHLMRAVQRMKFQADKNRTERSFRVGDWVYLKIQPYVQTSVADRANHKLAFRYFGPFQVQEQVGKVAYRLLLPPSSKIHLVFHVSQLKKALLPTESVHHGLPEEEEDSATPSVPEKILQRRPYIKGANQATQVKIKWSNRDESLATWENLNEMKFRFPDAPAWGKPVLKEGGMSPPVL